MINYIGLLVALFFSAHVFADDTDRFFGNVDYSSGKVMLLIDSSISMSEILSPCTGSVNDDPDCDSTKLSLAKKALLNFLQLNSNGANGTATNGDVVWPDSLQIGLARYEGSYNGRVLLPVKSLGQDGHRQNLIDAINAITAANNTPLLGSYMETVQYLLGEQSLFHSSPYAPAFSSDPSALFSGGGLDYVGLPNLGANSQCDIGTSILVLTDGRSNSEFFGRLTQWRNGLNLRIPFYQAAERFINDGTPFDYVCSSTLRTRDWTPANGPDNIAFWDCTNRVTEAVRDRNITTHVIAYNLQDYSDMQAWAENHGGGIFKAANSVSELAEAFDEVVGAATGSGGTLTAISPGVSVNAADRYSYLDEIYYSLFQPTRKKFWYGNLKKYKLSKFLDDQVADDQTGVFKSTARSEWLDSSDPDDGGIIHKGGAAAEIPTNFLSRNLYVSLDSGVQRVDGPSSTGCPTPNINSSNPECRLRKHFVDEFLGGSSWSGSNSSHSDYLAKVDSMIAWLRGDDVFDELANLDGATTSPVRKLYGAALHSTPLVVNYKAFGANSVQLDANSQDNIVFVSTNDGKLYAVDAKTGTEKFAYVPPGMLDRPSSGTSSRIEELYDAAEFSSEAVGGEGGLLYGLDSTWTVWRQDNNRDGNITPSGSNDFVYLYGGMRRGGRDYMALDVTKAQSSNSLDELFVLRGGKSGTETENMGQTWSVPTLGFVRYKNAAVPVIIVGGGYDEDYDYTRPSDPAGAQIYMVVARDVNQNGTSLNAGDVIWWASSKSSGSGAHVQVSDLTHSITGNIKTLDINSDGYVDHLYVGDLGGQLHRFDINNYVSVGGAEIFGAASSPSELVDAKVVAQLGIEASGANSSPSSFSDDRRFYHAPSVALMAEKASDGSVQKYVGVAIGSGWHANPNNDQVDDQVFFIKDYEPYAAAGGSHPTIQYDDLAELNVVNKNGSSISSSSVNAGEVASAKGVRIPLTQDAEKTISSPLIYGGNVYFTSYYQLSAAEQEALRNQINGQLPQDQQICSIAAGAASFYEYEPGSTSTTQLETKLNQNAATGITTALIKQPNQNGNNSQNSGGGSPPDTEEIAIGGSNTFYGLPEVDFSNVRKSSWRRKLD